MKGIIFCLVPLLTGMLFLEMENGGFAGVKKELAAAKRIIVAGKN